MPSLFSDISIRHKKIKNRIVMPPMVCFGFANHEGLVTDKNIQHYKARARGGAGLIIIEATCVNKNGRLSDVQLGLWSDEHIEGFEKIASACHEYGAVVMVQIHHSGLSVPDSVCNDKFGPSVFKGISKFGGRELSAREMSLDEINQVQEDFVSAAVRVEKAGLDGVELHGAHGFLISQFLSPLVNKRQDGYGGSLTKRVAFVCEIISRIRRATRSGFIIGCRMGCNEPLLKDSIRIAQSLEKSGVDLIHVSIGMSSLLKMPAAEEPAVPPGFPYNWIVYGGTEIKRKVKVPVIAVNGIRKPEQAADLIEKKLADFVAIGKGQLANPEWANEAQCGQKLRTCIDCKECSFFRPGVSCPVHLSRNRTGLNNLAAKR
jgi:NADPH2 dehydrogenase